MTSIQLTEKLKSYVALQLDDLSSSNPMIGFAKPLISRAINNNFDKITGKIDLIADTTGNIDVDSILSEMMESLLNTKPFSIKAPFIGDIEVGEGAIKLNIPMTDKKLIFSQSDLQSFKEILISK